jgi:hypothetical protein
MPEDNDSASINDITADPADLPKQPDEKDKEEKRTFDQDRVATLEQKLRDQEHYRKLRGEYSKKSFWFLSLWVSFVFLILFLEGFSIYGFDLSDTVLAVLVGSTTVSAIGLVGIVVRGLFPSDH